MMPRNVKTGNGSSGSADASPAAYFQSLSVENLRCFRQKQTLRVADESGRPYHWTIILGDNGAGKTTLLQCLAANQAYLHVPEPRQKYYGPMLLDISKGSLRNWTARSPRSSETVLLECSISVGAGLVDDARQNSITGFSSLQGAEAGRTSLSDLDVSALVCYGYGASRRIGTISLYEDRTPDTCASLFSDTSELLSPIEWLLTTDYAAARDTEVTSPARQNLQRVKDVLLRLLPGVEDFRFVPSPSSGKVRVEAQVPYGWVPVNDLSLGYKTSLTWMVDLADRLITRYPNSPDPLAEPAIVLIDEIDLHLHPQWQRQIVQQLTDIFKNTQFIVTAHSPLVVQAAQDANIVLLRREGDHVVIENNVEEVRNWRVDQILTSDLFGLPSARPPQLDEAIRDRESILAKRHLTEQDDARLAELREEIGALPGGERPEDMEAMDLIRRTAKLLQQSGGKSL